jgi:exopolysaccharide production protein ExoQ
MSQTEGSCVAFAVGFFFSFRLCIVLLSVRLLGLEPRTGTALAIGLDMLLFCCVTFYAAGTTSRSFRWLLSLRPVFWIAGFLVLSGISLLWSETASLPNSVIYWSGIVIDVANVTLILRSGTGTSEAHAILKGFVWSTCCLALIAWLMPTASDLRLGD